MAFDQKVFYRDVGLRIQLQRKRRDLTQEDVAQELGVSRASYANVEAGRQRVSLDVIWKLAVILGVSVESFVPEPMRGTPVPGDWLTSEAAQISTARKFVIPPKRQPSPVGDPK